MMGRYYVVRCVPGRDATAEHLLGRYDYEVFRPVLPDIVVSPGVTRMWKSREPEFYSLFPTYLFVKEPIPIFGWEFLHFLPDVFTVRPLLIMNNQLVVFDENSHDFRMIVKIQEDESAKLKSKPKAPFMVGDRIKVKAGPWIEFSESVKTIDNSGRIRFFTEMLGRHVQVSWDPSQAERSKRDETVGVS